jgi:hypothetical protein
LIKEYCQGKDEESWKKKAGKMEESHNKTQVVDDQAE